MIRIKGKNIRIPLKEDQVIVIEKGTIEIPMDEISIKASWEVEELLDLKFILDKGDGKSADEIDDQT